MQLCSCLHSQACRLPFTASSNLSSRPNKTDAVPNLVPAVPCSLMDDGEGASSATERLSIQNIIMKVIVIRRCLKTSVADSIRTYVYLQCFQLLSISRLVKLHMEALLYTV